MGGYNTASIEVAVQGYLHSCEEPCLLPQTGQTGPVFCIKDCINYQPQMIERQ